MNIELKFKKQVHQQALSQVAARIKNLQAEIAEAQKAASEETKSSAGDKYETGRAMLNLEKERFASQLEEANKLFAVLSRLNHTSHFNKAQLGSLVETSIGTFYLSAAIGQINVNDQKVYCISTQSPIGKALVGTEKDTKINFQNRQIFIQQVC